VSSFNVDLNILHSLEEKGLVSRTFRRLDPDRQAAVVTAIMEEAYRSGPGSIAIKKVADRAEVAVGSLYQYFVDRDAMLDFAVELVVRTLIGQLESSSPYLEPMPLAEALTAYLSYGIEWSREQAGFLKFFAAAAYHGVLGGTEEEKGDDTSNRMRDKLVRPIAESLQRIIRGVIAAARDRGELRPDCDIERVMRIVNVLLIAVGDAALMVGLDEYYRLYDQTHKPEDMIPAAVDLIMRGVAAKGRSP
jgi:AcrR family transcriptional regulator